MTNHQPRRQPAQAAPVMELPPEFQVLARIPSDVARRLLREHLNGLSALLTRFEFACSGCGLRLRGMVTPDGTVIAHEWGHVAEVVACRCLTCSEVVGTLCPIPMTEERHTNAGPMKPPRDMAPFFALEALGWTQKRIAKKMKLSRCYTSLLLKLARPGILLTRSGRRGK